MRIAIVLNCGKKISLPISADMVVCCDGGLKWCPVAPDVLLGDFDSLEMPKDFAGKIIRHDCVKNASDGELAVRYAKELHADEIVFYGVLGGRYDHTLCNFAIMRLAADLGMRATAREEGLDLYFARGRLSFEAKRGEVVSILPFGGEATVTASDALFYPLKSLVLTPSDSRGLSNVALGGKIDIEISAGDALVFHYLAPQSR